MSDVDLGQEAAAIAITPDGKRAVVVMNVVGKVGILEIAGHTVTYDKASDIPVGANPYNVDITPDGKFAVVGHTGGGRDNVDPLVTISLVGPHPHSTALTTVGTGPEGIAISPDGKYLAAPLLLGTTGKKADYFHGREGQVVLARIDANGALEVKSRAPTGAVPEGVVFSLDSNYVYVGNYADKTLQVFAITNDTLQPQGQPPLAPRPARLHARPCAVTPTPATSRVRSSRPPLDQRQQTAWPSGVDVDESGAGIVERPLNWRLDIRAGAHLP